MIDSAPVIDVVLKNDPAVSADVRQRVLNALEGGSPSRVEPVGIVAVAEILGCCPATVRRLAARGHLKPIRLSKRHIRYDRREVLRLREFGIKT